ncbi:unnamed protein product [marine sediment metagenome]|uniref:Translation elongation factor KOW-like domain-containing protein n=1 Tax=marine sediment metagenome TaxID=412755 RepID=X1RYT8_9ZZZZ
MASTADFKNGLCIEHNNDLFTIVRFQHVKPGKGPAFVRTKLKSVTTGKVIEKNNMGSKFHLTKTGKNIAKKLVMFLNEAGFTYGLY